MALTEAQELAFAKWMKEVLEQNKEEIQNAKPGITFDVDGYVKIIKAKEADYDGEEGKLTRLESEKREQTKVANEKLSALYKESSNTADTVVGHLGKDHKLSKIIRNKRDSMSLEAARGPDNPDSTNE